MSLDQRIASARTALQNALPDDTITPAGTAVPHQPPRRRSYVTAAIVAVAAIIVGVVIVVRMQSRDTNPGRPPASIPVTTAPTTARATLQLREVLEGPISATPGSEIRTTAATTTRPCAEVVPPASPAPSSSGWFWGEGANATPHGVCYRLGPDRMQGVKITSAAASNDPQQGGWGIDVTYAGDEFMRNVAEPLVLRRVAIVLDGDVLSAPVINPGITGSTIRINGRFTEASATRIAGDLASQP